MESIQHCPLATLPASTEQTSVPHSATPSEQPLETILEHLRHGQRFLVCSHTRPDGDAIGSMLAMGMLIEQMGKHVDLLTADRVPELYRQLPGAKMIRSGTHVGGTYDAVILLECDGLERAQLHGLEK